ncbi:MAG TPA: hypothetical protein VFS06_16650 [Casimicrobiaceae bacterium]|jgi:hypothetical protein|nr:hypothetical protein [Casimicrobiaceae bacterium]HWC45373.1 hypothetical protein [Casimicrobiaceae bacterium]
MPLTKCSIAHYAALTAALVAPAFASADSGDTIQWRTIVGIVQAQNAVGTGTGKVAGGGQPWTTSSGRASVNLRTGQVSFVVQGLVFAGGNTIGTPLPITQVKGTLVCDTNGSAGNGNSVLVDTPAVALDATGDAQFSGSVGALPAACLSEPDVAFLVRVPANNVWIANGAILQ